MDADYTLGIDFGTTNSVCAVLSGGDPEVLENAEGSRTTPSVAYYTQEAEQNRPLIGDPAVNKANENPERVVSSVKREMGESDFITVPNEDATGDESEYRVEEIAADIIRKLRTDAADKLGVDRNNITEAVITTPAYWESDRKQAVIQAGNMAGFDNIRTIKEPAAAAISYGRFKPGADKTVAVYDLGGGTFDFAIVDVSVTRDSDGGEYTVVTQSGDPHLGGDDWDQRVVNWISDSFESDTGIDPLEPHYSDNTDYEHKIRHERIRSKARQAKEALSNRATKSVDIRIPFLMDVDGSSYDVDTELSQLKFESLTEDLVSQTVEPIRTALADADRGVEDIDDVILVGGSTRMPQVSELVKSVFSTEPKKRVNPDEAVASGAAIKASKDDILLLEVTPLSLGIGVRGDRFKRMVNRNERLPTRTTEVFTTASEGSQAVRIPIYQGERDVASENRQLKTLIIQGMAPGKRNSAHVEVTFEVQQNGLINVRAVENTRNKSVGVEIAGENQLSDEYVTERVEQARELEDMDRRRQKVIEGQNDAEKGISDAEKLIDEFSHVFEEDDVTNTRQHVSNVRNIRQDDTATLGELRSATEKLNKWVLTLGDQIRESDARPQRAPGAPVTEDVRENETEDPVSATQTDQPGQVVTEAGGFENAERLSESGAGSGDVSGAGHSENAINASSSDNFEFDKNDSSAQEPNDVEMSGSPDDTIMEAETAGSEDNLADQAIWDPIRNAQDKSGEDARETEQTTTTEETTTEETTTEETTNTAQTDQQAEGVTGQGSSNSTSDSTDDELNESPTQAENGADTEVNKVAADALLGEVEVDMDSPTNKFGKSDANDVPEQIAGENFDPLNTSREADQPEQDYTTGSQSDAESQPDPPSDNTPQIDSETEFEASPNSTPDSGVETSADPTLSPDTAVDSNSDSGTTSESESESESESGSGEQTEENTDDDESVQAGLEDIDI